MKKKYYDLDFIKIEELKILSEFDRICRNNNIEYSLSGGTLLGAIRHKGFIPWDDDVDVMMTRDNYEKFCKLFLNDNKTSLFLQNYKTDTEYLNNFAKLVNTKIPAYIEETENLDIVRGICIDIFPIDKMTESSIGKIMFKLKMSVLSILKYSTLKRETNNIFKKIVYFILSKLVKIVGIHKINEIENNIRTKWNHTNSNVTFGDFIKPPYKLTDKDLLPYNIFEEYIDVTFDNYNYRAINKYINYLEIVYGDYMKLPPEENRKPDHNFYYYSE